MHPNGTFFLLCDSATLHSSPSGPTGPWGLVTTLAPRGATVAGTYEDAFLWLDLRGNWHALFHVYTLDIVPSCANSTVAAHWFSPDGLAWHSVPIPPYGNALQLADGSSVLVSTRERPKLIFDAATGEPTHLITAVAAQQHAAGTPCVNVKYQGHVYTDIAPLAVLPAQRQRVL